MERVVEESVAATRFTDIAVIVNDDDDDDKSRLEFSDSDSIVP